MANSRQSTPNPTFRRARAPRSPQELAARCYKIACKKLEADEKKPVYDVRQRLLLCVTLNKAERLIQTLKEPRLPWDDDKSNNDNALAKSTEKIVDCSMSVPIKSNKCIANGLIEKDPNLWGLALPAILIIAVLVVRSISSK